MQISVFIALGCYNRKLLLQLYFIFFLARTVAFLFRVCYLGLSLLFKVYLPLVGSKMDQRPFSGAEVSRHSMIQIHTKALLLSRTGWLHLSCLWGMSFACAIPRAIPRHCVEERWVCTDQNSAREQQR